MLALLAAGCGGAAKSGLQGGNEIAGAAGTEGLGANVMPASTLAFGDANIDVASPGWKRALVLGARFPSFGKVVLEFNKSLNERTDNGPTAAEVRSTLGGELAIGVTAVKPAVEGTSADPTVLGYAEVKDAAKLKGFITADKKVKALADRGAFSVYSQADSADSTTTYIAISSDAALLANDEGELDRAIDRSKDGKDRLADAQAFKDSMSTLPKDNILVGYVSAGALKQLGEKARNDTAAGQSPITQKQLDDALASYDAIKGVAYSVDATDGGFRLRSSVRVDEAKLDSLGAVAKQYQTFQPTLLSRIPSTAYLAASFQNLGPTLRAAYATMLEQPETKTKVAQFEAQLGVKLDDLVALTTGEHALYVGPGVPVSAGLLLKPADAKQGGETVRALTKLLGARGIVVHDTSDGQDATAGTFSGRWRNVDGVIAVGNEATVGDTAKEPLFETAAAKKLFADAGIDPTSKTAGALYVNVPKLVDMATSLGSLSSSAQDTEAIDNLRHIGGVLAWTTRDGDLAVSDVFVDVS